MGSRTKLSDETCGHGNGKRAWKSTAAEMERQAAIEMLAVTEWLAGMERQAVMERHAYPKIHHRPQTMPAAGRRFQHHNRNSYRPNYQSLRENIARQSARPKMSKVPRHKPRQDGRVGYGARLRSTLISNLLVRETERGFKSHSCHYSFLFCSAPLLL
jgi:hypothetical protein